MTDKDTTKAVLTLRPHHICCSRFLQPSFAERGPEYVKNRLEVKEILSRPDSAVMVAEGTDRVCAKCSYIYEGRCTSPNGDEDIVRKWDAILLKELGVPYGSCMTSGEWHKLIKSKIPFKICQKCRWNQKCSRGADLV